MFISSRLKLQKMDATQAEWYHQWRNDPEVMRFTSPNLDVYHLDETREFVNQVILGNPSAKCYQIIEKETETPIGITSLINIDYKNRNAECIIDIGHKESWGKGYGREAMKLLLDYAFLEMNLHRVSLRVFSFNQRAIKLYQNIGFQQEGNSRQSLYRDGRWHDLIHMGILHDEYRPDM